MFVFTALNNAHGKVFSDMFVYVLIAFTILPLMTCSQYVKSKKSYVESI